MIEQLVHALQALAAPADVQIARFPDFVVRADELALDFDDALRLSLDCPQVELRPAQREALLKVDLHLTTMSGRENAHLWTEAALHERAEWAQVRELAAQALQELGQPRTTPPPTRATYVRGRAP